jgi:hypothetical protein
LSPAAAYRRYCWPTNGLAGVRPAPLELLASKGATYYDCPHTWHPGPDYLRIICGPDYTEPANLDRLRQRGLGHKRSLALREYALDRVARGEPLWRIHEVAFAVLALESEPADPRL